VNLLIDLGNSRVKWALTGNGAILNSTSLDRQANWLRELPFHRASAVWLANVAGPDSADAVEQIASQRGLVCHRLLSEPRFGNLKNGYTEPERLGVDRWMACIGAISSCDASILVADAGTALTLDWIDAEQQHQGGLITPGVATMRHRLVGATQLQLPAENSMDAELGKSPSQAIERGTRAAAVAMIDAMAQRHATDYRLLTGGESELLRPHLSHDWHTVPDLVLEGIARYAHELQKNR